MSDENNEEIASAATAAEKKTEEKSKTSKAKEVAKEAIKKGAAKHSLLAALAPILMGVFVFIVILIIIIGIAMFFVAMPGMVMEQLKALGKKIGDAFARFFGEDQTLNVENEQIYDTLDYLEQMGYDLKGYGFLTDYVSNTDQIDEEAPDDNGVNLDEDVGVLRDNDDKIITAKSDFIYTYLVSDNYLYTIKNQNHVSGDGTGGFWNGLVGLGQNFLSFLSGGQLSQFWTRGFIEIYIDNGIVGNEGTFYKDHPIISGDKITLNTDSKTLEIKRGHGNNAITYNLDGWVGRYGMPVDFLMSVQLATMMSDLAYDMATTFETQLTLLLHPVGGGEKDANTAVGYYKVGEKYYSYDDFYEAAKSGITGFLNSWRVSNKEAMNIMKDFSISSPSDCEGAAEDGGVICSQSEDKEECCSKCRDYIQSIYDCLKEVDVSSLEIYQPYISKVENHWFRDIYFVADESQEFITYDYEYEALMKERWTLYETYTADENPEKEGEYKLYEVDEQGNLSSEPYEGTEEEAAEEGIKLSKKAEKIKISEEAEDLGWKEVGNKLAAYEIADVSNEDFQPAYPDIAEDDEDYNIKKDVYVNVITTGNVTQTGEGQRTETNTEIKKMFLQNKYFRYDGSAKTAEIITALREKLYGTSEDVERYGPIDESKIKDSEGNDITYELNFDDEKYTSDAENGEYKLSDYVANVTLNQDSLNAFSMLENTHTLDADYIYRDFKELMVELGYFTKEELTDETPRLLQFLVPDIGSGGYPRSSIDKREQEYGTMIHSKGDIKANEKYTLKAILDAAPPTTDSPEGAGKEDENSEIAIEAEKGLNPLGKLASMSAIPMANLNNIGAITNIPDADYTFEQTGSTAVGTKTGDLEYNGVAYEVWKQTSSTCTLYSFAFIAQAYTGESPETYLKTSGGQFINISGEGQGGNDYWAEGAGVIWDMFDKVGIEGEYHFPGEADIGTIVGEALGEGKPVYFYGDLKASAGYHAVVLLGAGDGGKVIYYDPGPGVVSAFGSSSSFSDNLNELLNTHFKHRIFIPNEVPTGVKKQTEAAAYEGYEGNEAVVSPVTGVLLEYGTYTDEDIDSVSGEEYRTNVDLKYGPANKIVTDEEGNPISADNQTNQTNPENGEPQTTGEGGEIVADKVGYAKILVLDAENYQKLEAATNNRWQNNSLVKLGEAKKSASDETALETDKSSARYIEKLETEEQMDNEHENWNNLDKTIYGYKEFAENYEKAGIAGQIIYIDGFTCELPDESLSGGEEGSGETAEEGENSGGEIAEQIPEGEELTIDSFKKVTAANLTGTEEPSEEDVLESKYEKEDEYKLASKKATDKLNAESVVKNEANSSIYLEGDDLIFIKEGTVIGRTMTDREVVEKVRKDPPHPYEYYRPDASTSSTEGETGTEAETEEENEDKLIGNYIRIIMRDLDDTVVENVEDYMKLDEAGKKNVDNDWELFYWLPFECYGVDLPDKGPECQGTCSEGETAVGIIQWTVLTSKNMNNISSQFIPGCLEYDSSLCAPLKAYESWSAQDFWNDYNSGSRQFQATLRQICDTDRDAFLAAQMDVAKKQYLDPILEEYPWLAERPSCVQGEIMHLKVWGADYSWVSSYQNSSDEEIILKVRNTIANTSSTAGDATGDESSGRAYNEPQIALEILNGNATLEDVEQWVRQQDYSVFDFTFK